jgi:hypothetical protein
MRGTYTAAFLHGLLTAFSRERGSGTLDLGSAFDLIVGTSTGAIVGCAAAFGCPMDRVIQLYRQHGEEIFPQKLSSDWRVLAQIPGRSKNLKRGRLALQSALESVLGNETLAQVYARRGIALAIPAVEMSQQRSWVFKTPHLGGHRDDNVRLVDACLASSAAPIYRSLAAVPADDGMGGVRVFADGGLWANNPVLVGLLDALKMRDDAPIEIFSVGSFPRPDGAIISEDNLDRGLVEWKFGGAAAGLSIAAQEFAFDNMARFIAGELTRLGRGVNITRFPTGTLQPSMLPYLDLDDGSSQAINALIDQARSDVNLAKSACDDASDHIGRRIRTLFESMRIIEGSEQ